MRGRDAFRELIHGGFGPVLETALLMQQAGLLNADPNRATEAMLRVYHTCGMLVPEGNQELLDCFRNVVEGTMEEGQKRRFDEHLTGINPELIKSAARFLFSYMVSGNPTIPPLGVAPP